MKRETKADRRREAIVAGVMADVFAAVPLAQPEMDPFDYTLMDETDMAPVAIIEIKVRTEDYDSLLISRAKVANLKTISLGMAVPAYIVWAVHTPDSNMAEVRFVGVDNVDMDATKWGGRTDRGEFHDIEVCVVIPKAKFARAGYADLRGL